MTVQILRIYSLVMPVRIQCKAHKSMQLSSWWFRITHSLVFTCSKSMKRETVWMFSNLPANKIFVCVQTFFPRLLRQCLFKNVWWWWASFGVVFSWIWLVLWPTTNRAHAREKKCDSMNLKWSKMLPSDNLYWFSHGIPPSQFVNNHWRQLTNDTK